MAETGFRNMRCEPLTSEQSMVVGIKYNGIKRPANRPGFRIAELRLLHEARGAA
jgi:hypothetical protein